MTGEKRRSGAPEPPEPPAVAAKSREKTRPKNLPVLPGALAPPAALAKGDRYGPLTASPPSLLRRWRWWSGLGTELLLQGLECRRDERHSCPALLIALAW